MTTPADIQEAELLATELRRRCLRDYVEACHPFPLASWQIYMCQRLQEWVEAIERGESPRLMVFVPPQHGKSTIVSRDLPAWIAGRHPEWPGILASYASSLAAGHGRWIRNQLREPMHRATFPESELADDSQAKDTMTTTAGGQILARGVGGGTTGNPAMYLIVDDPFADRQEADSITIRDTVDDWYSSVATTRLGPGAGVLVMHTRWHLDDLAGRLLKRAKEGADDPHVDQWEVVSFPAEWVPGCGADKAHYVEDGGALWLKSRFRPSDLRRKKANLPPRDWLSLYQQTPQLEGGQIIKGSWIIEEPMPVGWKPYVYQAWDLAGTKQDLKDSGCYSVGVATTKDWMQRWWLLDLVRGKWDSGQLVEQILAFGHKWNRGGATVQRIWLEDPVALWLEPFLLERQRQSGKHLPTKRVVVQGRGDKVARVQAALVPVMANGSFYVPKNAKWLPELRTELEQFPQGYLDQCDALSLVFAEAMQCALETAAPASATITRHDPRLITWDDLNTQARPDRRSPWRR